MIFCGKEVASPRPNPAVLNFKLKFESSYNGELENASEVQSWMLVSVAGFEPATARSIIW
jgi:hypothetical protein